MNNIIYPFQIPLYHSIFEEKIFKSIKIEVLKYIDSNFNLFKENWDCSTLSNFGTDLKNQFINKILNQQIKNFTKNYLNEWDLDFKNKVKFLIDETWINISPPKAFQETHHHLKPPTKSLSGKYSLFSGVFYINAIKNSGNLVLKNPNNINLNLFPFTTKNPNNITITPNPGHFIMFPSYLEHLVSPNQTNENRISISFNILYKYK